MAGFDDSRRELIILNRYFRDLAKSVFKLGPSSKHVSDGFCYIGGRKGRCGNLIKKRLQ
jgi:hypothetical protein